MLSHNIDRQLRINYLSDGSLIERCRQLTVVCNISVRQDGRAVVTGRGMYGWRIGDLGADGLVMAEFNIDIGKLPEDVREKLAELDLELSEGEWTAFLDAPLCKPFLTHPVHIRKNPLVPVDKIDNSFTVAILLPHNYIHYLSKYLFLLEQGFFSNPVKHLYSRDLKFLQTNLFQSRRILKSIDRASLYVYCSLLFIFG